KAPERARETGRAVLHRRELGLLCRRRGVALPELRVDLRARLLACDRAELLGRVEGTLRLGIRAAVRSLLDSRRAARVDVPGEGVAADREGRSGCAVGVAAVVRAVGVAGDARPIRGDDLGTADRCTLDWHLSPPGCCARPGTCAGWRRRPCRAKRSPSARPGSCSAG